MAAQSPIFRPDEAHILSLKPMLDAAVNRFNQPGFIPDDPISIPHRFNRKEDIEISGFLTALISWGNRRSILNNASDLMRRMDDVPYDFIVNHNETELRRMVGFVHRTFNSDDLLFLLTALQQIYRNGNGLESLFTARDMFEGITHLRTTCMETPHFNRSLKHLADPARGSAAKRIHMFLRWMVRNDGKGVDFGLWKSVSPASLYCPLDVHSGNVARRLGLLHRRQNDRKAVEELTATLRLLDAKDPVRYDFALFGMGVNGKSPNHL